MKSLSLACPVWQITHFQLCLILWLSFSLLLLSSRWELSTASFLFLFCCSYFHQNTLANINHYLFRFISLFSSNVWLMLRILDLLPKALCQVSTQETRKASEHSKWDLYCLFLFYFLLCQRKSVHIPDWTSNSILTNLSCLLLNSRHNVSFVSSNARSFPVLWNCLCLF